MKSELKLKGEVKEQKFPKMMIWKYSELVVLFSKNEEGIVVNGTESDAIGDFSDNWIMHNFLDLPKDSQIILTV